MNFAVAKHPTAAMREAASSGYPVIPAAAREDFAALRARITRCASAFNGSFCTGRQLAALDDDLADIAALALTIRKGVKTVPENTDTQVADAPAGEPSPLTVLHAVPGAAP